MGCNTIRTPLYCLPPSSGFSRRLYFRIRSDNCARQWDSYEYTDAMQPPTHLRFIFFYSRCLHTSCEHCPLPLAAPLPASTSGSEFDPQRITLRVNKPRHAARAALLPVVPVAASIGSLVVVCCDFAPGFLKLLCSAESPGPRR